MTTLFDVFHFNDDGAINFGDWPYGLEDLELIGDHRFVIGVPYDSQDTLRRYVFAAAKTYYLDNKSIDWVLKSYGAKWGSFKHASAEALLTRRITKDVKTHTRGALKQVTAAPNLTGVLGMFASWAALTRLQTTFRTAIFAIHNGFHFEASSLSRMILEQIAWAYSIYKINDESLFKVEPQKCITNLKSLFPNAGKLYGQLSEKAHITPEMTLQYVQSEEGLISVKLSDATENPLNALILLMLADMYVVLVEIIFSDLLQSFAYTKPVKGKARLPKNSRPTQLLLRKYYNKVIPRKMRTTKKQTK